MLEAEFFACMLCDQVTMFFPKIRFVKTLKKKAEDYRLTLVVWEIYQCYGIDKLPCVRMTTK